MTDERWADQREPVPATTIAWSAATDGLDIAVLETTSSLPASTRPAPLVSSAYGIIDHSVSAQGYRPAIGPAAVHGAAG